MSLTSSLRLGACTAAIGSLLLMVGCDEPTVIVRADTFPMGYADRFDQPIPKKPLFGSNDYVRSHDVLPPAKADVREPLPAAVALPVAMANIEVVQPQASTAQSSQEQGGVTPAAGMAAVITNAQGDGEKHKLDGGTTK
jgi:hypothetical protein